MPRSGDEARQRLQQAALDLFREQGFDRITTAQIAARAGLTERTFFRHFADKREVLFDGQEQLRTELLDGLAAAPDGPPLLMLFHAYRASLPLLEGNRRFSEPRFHVVDATPALQEREAAKLASINRTLAAALVGRGVDEHHATLATGIGMVAFGQATTRWLSEPPPGDLDAQLRRAFGELQGLTADLVVPRAARRTRRSA
ncbi:TetR/AcrR family transcriptional regulator [uncultured Jatrophihabitans sp.]|uniref:TetR/AcrR family transcriptional regulator n=1 Tax=uncultured Jatrophihabitans sp. TaxID=1610747 RepID=UPI0035C9F8C6